MAKKKEKKDSFLLYASQYEIIKDDFTDAEIGQIFRAINEYVLNGTLKVFSDKAMRIAFNSYIRIISINEANYAETCKRNSENVKKRYQKKDTNVYDRIQSNATEYKCIPTDSDIDIDIDIDSDIDSESESDINNNNTPTLEQVTEYINLNNYSVDPKKFYSCYQSKGWKGITDWKAKVDYWQYEDKKSNSTDFNDLDW